MKKPVIPIVFAANNKYVMFCYLAVYTVIKNAKSDYFYHIYVFQTNISDENCKLLESLSADHASVECVDISKYTSNVYLKESLHLSIETYYRLFIPCILPQYEKILYLDSDMCILSDVAELYACDLGDYAVGAAPDIPCFPLEMHARELGGLDCKKTFNAGVLVINTRKFEENRVREKCLELLAQDYKRKDRRLYFADQDALNIVLYENYYILDKRWNYQPQYLWRVQEVFEVFRQEYVADQEGAFIMHFAGTRKPWHYPELPQSDIFWKNAREIAEFDQLMYCIMADVRESEGKLKCFEEFQFPYAQIPFRSRVVIYAAGLVGKAFYAQLKESGYADLVLWVDQNWKNIGAELGVEAVERIADIPYDYLIIAIDSRRIADSIRKTLMGMNVPEKKIVWDEYRKKRNCLR